MVYNVSDRKTRLEVHTYDPKDLTPLMGFDPWWIVDFAKTFKQDQLISQGSPGAEPYNIRT